MSDQVPLISFKALESADFPLLVSWLNQPHVRRWWSQEGQSLVTLSGVARKLMPRIEGKEQVFAFIIYAQSVPIGYIQWYDAYRFPREGYALAAIPHLPVSLVAIDFYIGEPAFIGKGLAAPILSHFIQMIVPAFYTTVLVDPDRENIPAIKAYARAGFTELEQNVVREIQLMVFQRPTV
jgi:aminoglycoside 6'-N-acetyltransferase